MKAYEMTFIVRPDRDEEQIRGIVEGVTGRIASAGGEVLATVPWNPPRRRMAYPINDFGDGFYVTTVFNMETAELKPLESALRLNENVLRFLLVQATEMNIRQAQERVQHLAAAAAAAREAPAAPAPGAPEAPAPGTPTEAPTAVQALQAEPVAVTETVQSEPAQPEQVQPSPVGTVGAVIAPEE